MPAPNTRLMTADIKVSPTVVVLYQCSDPSEATPQASRLFFRLKLRKRKIFASLLHRGIEAIDAHRDRYDERPEVRWLCRLHPKENTCLGILGEKDLDIS